MRIHQKHSYISPKQTDKQAAKRASPSSHDLVTQVSMTYGIQVDAITPFSSGVMNDNSRISSPSGEFVLRIYRNQTERRTRFERFMLEALSKKGFPCPRPQKTLKGKTIAIFGGSPSILYPYIAGRQIQKATPSIMSELGNLQAQIHIAFAGDDAPIEKNGWDPDDVRKLMKKWKSIFFKSKFPSVEEYWRFLETELASCSMPTDLPRGFTHQDIKPENVIFNGKKVAGIIDFDNSYYGVLLHDLTTTIIWWCFTDGKLDRKLTDAFIQGYETKRKLTRAEKDLLLGDGLRFRLLREMFIGPMTTLDDIPLAAKRADYFKKLYANTFEK